MSRFDQDCWICEVEESITLGGGSSAPSGNTTTVQNTNPWSGQVPFLQGGASGGTSAGAPGAAGMVNATSTVPGVLPAAASLYQNYTPQYYPGTTYSPETAAQSSAITGQENLGLGGSPITAASNNAALGILNPNFLTSNPGNAAYNDILNGGANVKAAIANAAPGLMDQFTGGQTVTPNSGASYGVGQGIGNAVANLELQAGQGLSQNYGQAAGQQNTANYVAPNTQGLAYTDLSNAYGAGATQQGLGQNVIQDAMARYNYGQTLPYNLLDYYSGIVNGNGFGSSSTLSSPYFQQQTGGLGAGLSGAMSGAALGSAFGPWGTAIGAVGGGLLGGFG